MVDQKFNIITFTFPSAGQTATLTLKLDGEFVWSCGLEPNINRFIVPFTEFDKLGGAPDQTGTLEFWYSQDPTSPGNQPDWSIQQQRIIDVSANQVGECKATPAGAATTRVTEYTLYIADFRERLVAPRGGRLFDGFFNAGFDDVLYPTAIQPQKDNQQMAQSCLKAMGLDSSDVDSGLTSFHALMNQQWHGAHAPTELAKILEHCNAVLCPQTDGKVSIQIVGNGDKPTIPAGQQEYLITLPGIDRRGKICIFSSAPTGVLNTYTLSGVDHASGGSNPLIWVTASAGVYSPMASMVSTINSHGTYPPDAYMALQLQPTKIDPRAQPVMLRVFSDDTVPNKSAIAVSATIAVQAGDGSWSNQAAIVPVTHIYNEGNVICMAQRLGQVTTPTPTPTPTPISDPDAAFQEIPSPGPTVTVTVESLAPSPANPLIDVREFFYSGWQRTVGGGSPVALSSDAVASALAEPGQDVVIIHRPEMRLVRSFSGNPGSSSTDNSADLISRCSALASRYLRDSGVVAQEIACKGFVGAELSGQLAEIRIDQERVRTVFKLNTWWLPSGQTGKLYRGEGGYAGAGAGGGGAGSGGAAASAGKTGGSPGVPGGGAPSGGSTHSIGSGSFPHQDQTDPESIQHGATTGRQPCVAAAPPAPPPNARLPGGTQYQVRQRPSPSDGYKEVWDYVRAHG